MIEFGEEGSESPYEELKREDSKLPELEYDSEEESFEHLLA